MTARDPGRLWGSWGFNPWVVGMPLGTGTRKAKAVIRGFQPHGDKQQKKILLPGTLLSLLPLRLQRQTRGRGEGRRRRWPPWALKIKMGDGKSVEGRATSSSPQRMGPFQ